MRAIAVWLKDTPVGSPRQCADFVSQWREELLASIWTSGLTECHLWVTCGRRPGKNFLTFCSIGRVRSRVRPVDAAGVAAGPNALRGSSPKQKRALEGALTQTGSPDPRNNRICITSSCPRQLVLPIYLLACLMPPATVSAPCISRRGP